MRALILTITGIIAVILQGSVLSMFPLWGVQVDIILLLILAMAIAEQSQAPALFALIAGALLDILYSPIIGFFAAAYAATALIAVLCIKRLKRINIATALGAGFLGSIIAQGICLAFSYAAGVRFAISTLLTAHILPQAALTAALMPLAYFIAVKLMRHSASYSRRKTNP